MEKVSREVAELEVIKWLDFKKVSQTKRESSASQIDTIIDAFADGTLILNDDFSIKHLLKFPTDGEKPATELTYKPRLRVGNLHQHLQGVKTDDADGRVCAYIAATSGTPKGIIKGLDIDDYNISQAIIIFFL